MFKSSKVVPAYQHLIGWRQHYDDSFQIADELTQSETGEFFQQKHPALDLAIIGSLIPPTMELNDYLTNTVTDATNEIFNDLLQYRQINKHGKTLLEQSVLLNRYGWANDTITNQGRFVGFQIRTKDITGLQSVINEIGLQFAGNETFKLYLFHSSKLEPLDEIDVTTTGTGWNWIKSDIELNSFESLNHHGGVFVLGYYQDDITSNAINYTSFNWDRGVCGGCNDSHSTVWKSINNNFHIYPLYVPAGSFTPGEMFDMNKVIYSNTESFGLNLKLSVRCDLTDFFVQNKFVFKNLLSLKVVHRILNDMKFSQQINAIEENIKMMIIRDLEGDIETKLTNIPSQYNKELKSVTFNMSGINSRCLPCEDIHFEPTIGVI